MTKTQNPFKRLGLPPFPVILAPLAGVSDHPFRRICTKNGADLTYVEMISATALLYESRKTYDMLARHESEEKLGVQITGKTAKETAEAIEKLDDMPFDTIDINMGCPVRKVVKTGCGSAIIRDPKNAREYMRLARQATAKPLSIKIRLGWEPSNHTALEIVQTAEELGIDWVTVHGRTRADSYQVPVDLDSILKLTSSSNIPIIGNGNIFSAQDAKRMRNDCKVHGVMVSRGALGNPFVFREIKSDSTNYPTLIDEWYENVKQHIIWQQEAYGEKPLGVVCMRKHLLWYIKGWPCGKYARDAINKTTKFDDAIIILDEFYAYLKEKGNMHRHPLIQQEEGRFIWDPKFDMDRKHDRGVGDDGLQTERSLSQL